MIIHGHIRKSKAKQKPKAVREQYEQWLESVLSQKTNFSRGKITKKVNITPTPYRRETPQYPSLDTGAIGTCTKPVHGKMYTGDKMIGIGTLHKSNAVPVFTDEEAVSISSMRR